MTLEQLKDRLAKCKVGEFFGVARDTIAYAEQLKRERDEAVELARRAHAWIDHGVKTTARVEWCTEFERLLSHIEGGKNDRI